MEVREWSDPPFHPPGTSAVRALQVGLDDSSVTASFLNNIGDWGKKLARGAKATWDEAVCPANMVPNQVSSVSAKEFVAAFAHQQFTTKEHQAALNCRRLPPVPKHMLDDELGARLNFLSCLNATITTEAVLRQQGSEAAITPALSAILKSTLQPLWTAFCLFVEKKVALRKRALKGCWTENQLVQKLFECNMLSEQLFDKDTVEEVFAQAEHQAKSVASLLEFKPEQRKQKSSARGRGTPNRRGQNYRGRGTPSPRGGNRGNYYQGQQGQGRGAYQSHRGYPSTPRGNAYRGKGRGGRSPGTPKATSTNRGTQ